MRPKTQMKLQAIELRKQGLSYSEIQKKVPVSQASLSLWLNGVKLTKQQKERLAKRSLVGQKAGAKAQRVKRLQRIKKLSEKVEKELPLLMKDPFFVSGVMLYAAEGTKQKPWNVSESVSFANSDHSAVLLMRQWFYVFCGVRSKDIGYRLHIHATADDKKAREKWADILGVNVKKITITLKRNDVRSRHNRGEEYKGLVHLRVYKSTDLNRRIELWAKGVMREFLKKEAPPFYCS